MDTTGDNKLGPKELENGFKNIADIELEPD